MYRMSATECQVKNLLRISGGSDRFGTAVPADSAEGP